MKIVPVVLAGGIGERFWPLSRSSMPKQLLPLISTRSMLDETLARLRPLCKPPVRPLIMTGKTIAAKVKKQLTDVRYDMLVEPVGKSTAPAVALGAAYIRNRHGEAVMLVLSADHAISPRSEFVKAVRYAATLAEALGRLVVFGIPPSRPDTGYGYILTDKQLGEEGSVIGYAVKKFIEKPDWEKAVAYCKSGSYFWNSGMFVWKTSVILNEVKQHMPELYAQVQAAERAGFSHQAIDRFYQSCQKESIDFGVMERSTNVAMVAGHFLWDDVGSWESVGRIHPGNQQQTTVVGKRIYESACRNSIIVNDANLNVAAVGLDNIVLVAAHDAVLALPRTELPNIKKHLAEMKKRRDFPSRLF